MKTKITQDEIIRYVLREKGSDYTPGYDLLKKEVWINGEKYFLGSSADRCAREMAEHGEIERKRIGKFAYYRLKQEHKQETMFNFTNHALGL